MNILFLTLLDFDSLDQRNIYTDLLREFAKHGHKLWIISPVERRKNKKTKILTSDKVTILKLKIGNIQKTGIIEKTISTLSIEKQFVYAIKKYFSSVKFDFIIYSTPPITFYNAIKYTKNRDGSKTYLLLKDIFPQNAVDLGMMSKSGIRSIIYKYFRSKEKKLYAISDKIGCMSQANAEYLIKHNPEINYSIVEVCPNSIDPIDISINEEMRLKIRRKYNLPLTKKIFVYGGNLGKPQGIDFLIKCVESQKDNSDIFFLIIGDGTEYCKVETYVQISKQMNLKILKKMTKQEYDLLVAACDIGMIFLDYRFTIPNFPSRLLGYMQASLPVLAVTDACSDIGKIIVEGGFGWWCKSDNVNNFIDIIKVINKTFNDSYKVNSFEFLLKHFSVEQSYNVLIRKD